MNLWDYFKGSESSGETCSFCEKPAEKLAYRKKIDEQIHSFCSRECSHNYRLMVRRQKRNPI